MKKRSIHFSDEWLKEIDSLANIIGIAGTYGETPNALRFGTTFSIWAIKTLHRVTHDLKDNDFDLLVSSIKRLRKLDNKAGFSGANRQ